MGGVLPTRSDHRIQPWPLPPQDSGPAKASAVVGRGSVLRRNGSRANVNDTAVRLQRSNVNEFRLQEEKLSMVVNKTTLDFSDEELAKMVFVEGLDGKAREHRQLLHDNFSQVAVRIITNSNLNRNENFAALNNSLFSPMGYGGATLSGPQVTAFMQMILEHWNSTEASVMKTMVEIKLRPQMDYLLIDFENSLPKDYQDRRVDRQNWRRGTRGLQLKGKQSLNVSRRKPASYRGSWQKLRLQ